MVIFLKRIRFLLSKNGVSVKTGFSNPLVPSNWEKKNENNGKNFWNNQYKRNANKIIHENVGNYRFFASRFLNSRFRPKNDSNPSSKPYRVDEKLTETPKRTIPSKKRARASWSSSSSSCSSDYSSGSTSSSCSEDRSKRRKRCKDTKPRGKFSGQQAYSGLAPEYLRWHSIDIL